MELSGKAAIVTGAATGVGRSTALALARAGCDVVVNYSRSKDVAEEVAAEATSHGVRAIAVQASVADDGGGQIVNVSSVAGVYGTGSSIPYCASRAGLNNLIVTLARVIGPEVQVNTVCPGFIDGSWLQEGLSDAFERTKKAAVDRTLLDAVCTPDDVKDASFGFLLGSRLTTGEILVVDGGYGKAL